MLPEVHIVVTAEHMSPNRSGLSVHVNACSELFLDLVNKRIATLSASDIPAFWNLVCEISRVVMGDAPLIDIFSGDWEKKHEQVEEKEEESDKGCRVCGC